MDNPNIFFRTFQKFDGFGASVNLQIDGDKNEKNLLGAGISIGMLAISIALSFSTFLQFVNGTNPSITGNIEYANQNLTINYTNFFFGISFFKPLKNVRELDSKANDIAAIKYINQLNISCSTCEGEFLNSNAIMNLCNSDQFKDIPIKSMSASKSKGLNSIFSAYSFCFPEEMKTLIKDNTDPNSTQESSLQLFIPINTVSIEFTSVKQNLNSQPGTESLSNQISTSSPSAQQNQPQTTNPPLVVSPVQSSNQQPTQNPFGNQQPQQGLTPTGATQGMQSSQTPTGGLSQPTGTNTGGIGGIKKISINFFVILIILIKSFN